MRQWFDHSQKYFASIKYTTQALIHQMCFFDEREQNHPMCTPRITAFAIHTLQTENDRNAKHDGNQRSVEPNKRRGAHRRRGCGNAPKRTCCAEREARLHIYIYTHSVLASEEKLPQRAHQSRSASNRFVFSGGRSDALPLYIHLSAGAIKWLYNYYDVRLIEKKTRRKFEEVTRSFHLHVDIVFFFCPSFD